MANKHRTPPKKRRQIWKSPNISESNCAAYNGEYKFPLFSPFHPGRRRDWRFSTRRAAAFFRLKNSFRQKFDKKKYFPDP